MRYKVPIEASVPSTTLNLSLSELMAHFPLAPSGTKHPKPSGPLNPIETTDSNTKSADKEMGSVKKEMKEPIQNLQPASNETPQNPQPTPQETSQSPQPTSNESSQKPQLAFNASSEKPQPALNETPQHSQMASNEIVDPFADPLLPLLYDSDSRERLTPHEIELFISARNRKAWRNYRIGLAQGNDADAEDPFIDCRLLQTAAVPPTWPTRLEINLVAWQPPNSIIGLIKLKYDNVQLMHGSERGRVVGRLVIDFAGGEKVSKIRMSRGPLVWDVYGIAFMELTTNTGEVYSIGTENPSETIETAIYDGCVGLKGFFGKSGEVLRRAGPIWGRE